MYQFLSEEWIEAARAIRHQYADQIPAIAQPVRLNLVVTDVPAPAKSPSGDGTVWAYIDTSSGVLELELGELDEPDAAMMTDYPTAKAMLVDRDPQSAVQSMMEGKIRVQGDMMKLIAFQMALQTLTPDPELADTLAAELDAITLP